MTAAGLTSRERDTLNAIAAYQAREGISPTVREIADALGVMSPGSVHRLLASLKRKGAITSKHGRWRSIAIVERAAA